MRAHLRGCAACRARARELRQLSRALTRLARWQPPPGLAQQTLAAIARRSAQTALPAWWPRLLATGAAMALLVSVWVVGEALAAFQRAGGGELLSLIHSYPHLVWRYPTDTALAVLEALPVASVAAALTSALLAWLLGAELVAMTRMAGGWPGANGQPWRGSTP